MGLKEERIKATALSYYSRKDVQEAIYEFCKSRETVHSYNGEYYGKRPNSLEYPTEVLTLARDGATSFHCSEELWDDPLDLHVGMDKEDLDKVRKGWDLLIDIDSKYFDYAKKAAISIIEALESNGIKSYGIKFSGSKGFHILVPWTSFPEEINGRNTCEMFPEWPRIILDYLKKDARKVLEREIESLGDDKAIKKVSRGIKCLDCGNIVNEYQHLHLICPNIKCRRDERLVKAKDAKVRKRKCPEINCGAVLELVERRPYHKCDSCKINSLDYPNSFSTVETYDVYEQLGLDLILVSSRHLFRAPYSLHEKTSLASIPINKDEIQNFQHKDANPLRVKIRNFSPKVSPDEAKKLLVQALDWYGQKLRNSESNKEGSGKSSYSVGSNKNRKYKDVDIDRSKMKYPPAIDTILKGMGDGRKRALFILINYFRCMNFSQEEIKELINEWNSKNKKKIKEGYIKGQIQWTFRNKKILPPNYDKSYYRDIGVKPTPEEERLKNPVSYTVRKFFQDKKTSRKKRGK